MDGEAERGQRRARVPQVKNKSPAPVQITAEQIIREAQERQDAAYQPPKQKITDADELADYRLRKRKEFEDSLRRQRMLMTTWIKYAKWEESQREYERARNIYERALDVDYRNVIVWLKYAEMEMRNKNVNLARNIWDRAVTVLPRVNQLWYKYIYMEDILGNYAGARMLYERWMEWEPDEQAWNTYIKFELRNGETELARNILARFVRVHPTANSWLRWAKFEEKLGNIDDARAVLERAVTYLAELADEKLFIAFAAFEERAKEIERARAIYKYALDNIPKARAQELFQTFVAFEKQHGDKDSIEVVILGKRRFQYEEELKSDGRNYDVWFDYARLEEANGDVERVREVYERAVANVPPAPEKRFWRRYIYLWINYALYEELEAKDFARTRQVYLEALRVIPHEHFSFAKLWVLFAQFELRQGDLDAARLVLGNGMGRSRKERVFVEYIQLELQLGNVDRCRTLYQKYLEAYPASCKAWTRFAELERFLNEIDRARGIFELAIEQPALDMPELLWKAYIDFEIELGDTERTAALYRRLLERTKHVKVWISYAQFLASLSDAARTRQVYEQAHAYLKSQDPEERVLLLQSWKEWEDATGDPDAIQRVTRALPKRVKKKRLIRTHDGASAGWEEYYDYIFPDDHAALPNLKILERAHLWKQKMHASSSSSSSS
eukprot:TRINITY_DN5020_c0_g1_i1.p1 TRINITY_DN5020_c0_g1~~TRINITY_DN5020_c0_g1_i1.p1  ORF type:complete len:672 (-),score=128.42 TRINITY_DN5020_c0_g1_i1:24-2039(-)